MRHLTFLCSARVCRALKDKYKDDMRHAMTGMVWEKGKWKRLKPRRAEDQVVGKRPLGSHSAA